MKSNHFNKSFLLSTIRSLHFVPKLYCNNNNNNNSVPNLENHVKFQKRQRKKLDKKLGSTLNSHIKIYLWQAEKS